MNLLLTLTMFLIFYLSHYRSSHSCKLVVLIRIRYNVLTSDFWMNSLKKISRLSFDPKLRWVLYYSYIYLYIFKCSNFLRFIISINSPSHLLSLFIVCKLVVRAKIKYGIFLLYSIFRLRYKLNSILASCLRSIVEAIRCTPQISLEILCTYLSIVIRSRWLAGKFLLKIISNPHSELYTCFYNLNIS